jgi:hypothetical protein
MELSYTYWAAAEGGFIGYLHQYPAHWTQGETLSELEEMLQSLYADIRQLEDEAFIEAEKIFQKGGIKSDGRVPATFLEDILQSIADNGNSIQVLLSENGDSAFQKRFFRKDIEAIRQFTETAGIKVQDKVVARYRSVFLVGGIRSLVQEWLQNGMDTPAPELAKMLARLMQDALR